jgi:processive 1,2-diacylglycerol beta-glucosyltransferase
MSKKVLILHTSVGLGHKYIALNIGHHLTAQGFAVRVEDVMQVQSGPLVKYFSKFYLWWINKMPWAWKWIYTSNLFNAISMPFRTVVAGSNYGRIKALTDEYDPDIVIATQTAASAVLSYMRQKGMYRKLFGIAFSDYHLHPYWVYDEADFYLANIKEQKDEMLARGISADKILVMGMALAPKPARDRAQIRQELGVTTSKAILFTGGSLGFGITKEYILGLLRDLKSRVHDFTLLVVCGKDQESFKRLSEIADPQLKVFGFYSPMDDLYVASDVFVGKPGGLTIAEALHYKLPVIVTHWMPGGEEMNIEYLIRNRLILPTRSGKREEILREVANELTTGAFKAQLQNNPAVSLITNTDPSRIGEFVKRF